MSFFKKIDKLIAKSFVAPYVLSFVIAEFVLVMQFLWQKIDDILGKGVSAFEISGLIGYFSVVIMPRAIPITILLSSVFVYGNMAERYELTSMKSAGLSFTRILRSGFTLAVLTAIFSLLASNIFAPKAHYLFQKKFNAIKKQKAALLLESGQFNKDFSGFTIYVGDKDKTGRNIEEVLMYDENFTDPSLVNMVSAKSGVMEPTEDGRFFRMLLRDGVQYRDLKESRKGKDNKKSEKYPFVRTKFKEWEKIFDMTQFDIDDSNSLSTNKEDLMHSFQLLHLIDSLETQKNKNLEKLDHKFGGILNFAQEEKGDPKSDESLNKKEKPDSKAVEKDKTEKVNSKVTLPKSKKPVANPKKVNLNRKVRKNITVQYEDIRAVEATSLLDLFKKPTHKDLLKSAHGNAQRHYSHLTSYKQKLIQTNYKISRVKLKLHQKYSWALMCIIFLFIGAPMGSIIRKGGFGYPLLVSILFFMLFVMLQIAGEKILKSMAIGPVLAAWLPCIVIGPVGFILSIMALKDFHSFSWRELLKLFK